MVRRVVPREDADVRQVVDPADLGVVLRAERIRRGVSQDEIGGLVGLTRQKVQQLEAGHPGVAVGTVLRTLADLGVRLVAIPMRSTEATQANGVFAAAEDLLSQVSADRKRAGARLRVAGDKP